MAQIIVNITKVLKVPNTNNLIITLEANNGSMITREIDTNSFDTWEKFAQWILDQKPDFMLESDKIRNLLITFHNELDEETNISHRVLDNVVVSGMP